jgi:L-lactate dehydrogenase complex protein LldF
MGKLFGRFRWLPLAGSWTRHRDFPAPDVQTFQAQWKRRVRTR